MAKVSEAHLEARREQILEAAIACFARLGFHKTTMADIAREAGLSAGLAYRYFASKEEIIQAAAVQREPSPELLRWIEEEVARFDDFLKLMDTFTRLDYQRFEPGTGFEKAMQLRIGSWAEALQNPEVRQAVLKRLEHHLAASEQMVRRAQELGQINPDLDPAAAARVLQAISDGFKLLWTLDPNFDVWQFREVEMALYSGTFWCGERK